jgi:hypothetical protein
MILAVHGHRPGVSILANLAPPSGEQQTGFSTDPNLPARPISVGMTLRIAVHYSNGFGLAKAYCKRPLYED